MIKTQYVMEFKKGTDIVLLNLITFDFLVLSGTDMEKWGSDDLDNISTNAKEALVDKKFIINDVKEDKELLAFAQDVFSQRKPVRPTAVIYLTNECNLRCKYCYTGYENDKSNETIDENDIEKIINAIQEIYKLNNYENSKPTISLFGGEPLLPSNKKMVEHIINKFNEYNYDEFEIVTNLVNVRLYENILKQFKGDISLEVTLNGNRDIHDTMRIFPNGKGTYDIILDNVQYVLDKCQNVYIDLSVLIEKSINVDSISELFSEMDRRGFFAHPRFHLAFGHIQFRSSYVCPGFENRVIDVADYYPLLFSFKKSVPQIKDSMILGSSMYILKELYNSIVNGAIVTPDFKGCHCTYFGRLCFFTDGYIYPCYDCVGMKGFEIGEYRNRFKLNDFYDQIKHFSVTGLEKCNRCKFVGVCNGGCIVSNISKNGNINDAYCENVEKAFLNFLDYLYSEGLLDEFKA